MRAGGSGRRRLGDHRVVISGAPAFPLAIGAHDGQRIGRAPGHDDLVVAAGHVFGNGAGPTTGRLVADLICGDEPVVDPTPFRLDRPGLETSLEASIW